MAKFKEPKQTVKAYKLFRVDQRQPGKLFPLFVHANQPVDLDTWHEAQIGEMTGDKVKSKIGPLAFRPGWHAGDLPVATHIGEKSDPKLTAPDTRPANHVWAEVEMPDDVDWQSVANERGTNAQGRIVPVKAHITDQIPKGGHYRYKTNSNMTGNWLIGGAMKVNKVLSDKEVRAINKAAGVADLPRATPFPAKKYGFAGGGTVAPDEWKAEAHVNYSKAPHMNKGGRPPQQTNLDMAREAAERVGQHHDPLTRSLQQGYEHGWYHGSTGDIKAFDPNTRGESTGAASAKKGYFFARDPSTPPPEMLEHDPESLALLQRIGATIPPKPTMAGHGAHTASSYAGTGGSREYKEAMRMAKAAERVGNWDAHQKYMQMAEDAEINNMRYRQDLVAKHGDARDTMYEHIKNAWYGAHNAELFKGMSQPDYEAHDKRYKELMPYGWHIDYEKPHYEALKAQLKKFGNNKQVQSALDAINHYQSVHNERKAADVESGANVMPVALRYKNPMYHDFKGSSYRDQTYSDLMDQAMRGGHDALILKNTYDPGGTGKPKMVDVGVMFHPSQVRSKFAAFDPTRTKESDLLAKRGGVVHMADGGDVDQGDPLSNLPPISPQQTTAMDKYRLALWAEKNNPDMLTANNNELAALLMTNRKGQTYDDRSEEEPTLKKRSVSSFNSPEQFQNMPGDNTFGQRREMPRPESFDYPRLEKGDDYRRPEQERRQKRDEITRQAMELGFPFRGTYYAHGGRVTHAHHLDIEERPL